MFFHHPYFAVVLASTLGPQKLSNRKNVPLVKNELTKTNQRPFLSLRSYNALTSNRKDFWTSRAINKCRGEYVITIEVYTYYEIAL